MRAVHRRVVGETRGVREQLMQCNRAQLGSETAGVLRKRCVELKLALLGENSALPAADWGQRRA
jgi:hypothetical protein